MKYVDILEIIVMIFIAENLFLYRSSCTIYKNRAFAGPIFIYQAGLKDSTLAKYGSK